MQRVVKQNTRMIPGERSAGAIGAMQSGCEPDDEPARCVSTERGHGRSVVTGEALPGRFPERRKPRTTPALRIEQRVGHA